jgi:hypothetical protein
MAVLFILVKNPSGLFLLQINDPFVMAWLLCFISLNFDVFSSQKLKIMQQGYLHNNMLFLSKKEFSQQDSDNVHIFRQCTTSMHINMFLFVYSFL